MICSLRLDILHDRHVTCNPGSSPMTLMREWKVSTVNFVTYERLYLVKVLRKLKWRSNSLPDQPYDHVTHIFPQPPNRSALRHRRLESHQPGHASQIAVMRTYDDTFSGEKIYPGKVRRSILTQLQSAARPTLLPSRSGGNSGLRLWLLMCYERC